ncbi:MAG: Pls/PosA family non-ribosomal peptide synthetase [Ornithinimicrobium sp.]
MTMHYAERTRPGVAEADTHRSPATRLHHYFQNAADATPDSVALECDNECLTYRTLDVRANQLANHLLAGGLEPGSRIGILVPRSVDMYVALLATLKASATFVPIDTTAPQDRIAYIAEDSDLDLILTTTGSAHLCEALSTPSVCLDAISDDVRAAPPGRPRLEISGDPTCYIIYTSASTGRPKGVAIAQSSICNFIGIVPDIYTVTPSDRVYQGMTLVFDFSIEEIWPTWAVGATLVAGPTDGRRVGSGLAQFLEDSAITMIYCVPTVLATLDRTIASIRTVNVGGEACPPELVQRWGDSGRLILNTYGPTETTVTCTYAVLSADKPVTIGIPLPSYSVLLLDEDRHPVPDGEIGEICVGGPGVAKGYVNRPDLTADRFIQHDGERIYRTGDLGRYLEDGEIEYLGRGDSEVKVRGHRVELQEIESVLLQDDDVAAAVVKLVTIPDVGDELAAYVVLADPEHSDEEGLRHRLHGRARTTLPSYMVPTFLERIDAVPMMPSGKVDRVSLPTPEGGRLVGGTGDHVSPDTHTERHLASVWESTLVLPEGQVSVEADLFEELGGHSLVVATLVSQLRSWGHEGAQGLSILDVYAQPTIRDLARLIDERGVESELMLDDTTAEVREPMLPPRTWRVLTFGLAQVSWIYALLFVFVLPIGVVYSLNNGVPSLAMGQQLVLSMPVSYLFGRWVLPLASARLLSVGLREGTYPLWGWAHLRVWAVQRAMSLSPLARLVGSPWAGAYLRLAGARVGQACHIGSSQVPLPRFVHLEDNTTIGYAVHLSAFDIVGGALQIGRIQVGKDAVVAANCVLQGPCTVGNHAILREQSLLSTGDSIPDNAAWSGSPATPQSSAGDPVFDLMARCQEAPRFWPRRLLPWFAVGLLVLELIPLLALVPMIVVIWGTLLIWGQSAALLATALSGPVFVISSCSLILAAYRFALVKTPVGIHHLRSQLGLEKWFGEKLLELSLDLNNSMYATLYTPAWLRQLGAKVGRSAEVATIANIDPDLLTLEDECFVADMASVGSATYCNGHVAFRETVVGTRAFVGNASFIPSGTHLADGSLVGVQSVPPVGGVARGTSWLGSPPFFLPKREIYEEYTEEQTFRPTDAQVGTRLIIEFLRIVMPASILALSTFGTLYAVSLLAVAAPLWVVVLATPVIALVGSLLVVLAAAALKWLVVGRYRPRVEPLWSGFVRRTEFVTGIYETTAVPALLASLCGTPFLGPLLRLFGVRVGRRTLVDTTYLTEFDLVHIGDDVSVGTLASLQTHLFEDRVMKMSTISLAAGASVGNRGVVLYDSTLEEGSELAPLSLVMKGEALPRDTSWSGRPAQFARRLVPRAEGAQTENASKRNSTDD